MALLDLTLEAEVLDFDLSAAESALSPEERALAIESWRGRMRNEHVSARIFAQLLPQMMDVGVPARSQEAVARMIADELRHGRLCAGAVLGLGGEPICEIPPLAAVPLHPDADALEGLLRNVLSVSCLSETVAVSLISAERLHPGHPVLEETLTSILADEVQHARFGWNLLAELGGELDAPLRARLGDYLAPAFAHLRKYELENLAASPSPSKVAEDYGICDGPSARQIFFDTVRDVIIPGLEDHGLPARRAWEASLTIAA